MGALRPVSRVLAAATWPLEPPEAVRTDAAATVTMSTSAGAAAGTPSAISGATEAQADSGQWGTQRQEALASIPHLAPLVQAFSLVGSCATCIQEAHSDAQALQRSGGDAADGSLGVAAAAQRLRDRGGQLYRLLVSELYDSQVLEHGARLLLLWLLAPGSAGRGQRASGPESPDSQVILTLCTGIADVACSLVGAYFDTAGPSLGVCGTAASRPDVPPPPWGHCTQYLALANAVSALAAAGFGGGCGEGNGTYGMPPELAAAAGILRRPQECGADGDDGFTFLTIEKPALLLETLLAMLEMQLDCGAGRMQPGDSGGSGGSGGSGCGGGDGGTATTSGSCGISRAGLWSFIVSPRVAHHLCMRIADLAIASGQEGQEAGGAGASAGRQQRALSRRRLLPADCAWPVAARALVAARGLALGPMRSQRRAGTTSRPLDPQLDPGSGLDPGPLLPAEYWRAVVRLLRMDVTPRGADTLLVRRVAHLLVVPDMATTMSTGPSASVAAAFTSGLVAGLERCSRFLGSSSDPDDVDIVGGLLLPALGTQPRFFPHMLAFGPPGEVAPLLSTLAKLLHRCVDEAEEAAARAQRAAAAAERAALRLPNSASRGVTAGGGGAAVESRRVYGNLVRLANNMEHAAGPLICDPRLFMALGPSGPEAKARPQLRQLLSLLVQRWLPPLSRAALLAPRLPGAGSYNDGDLYGITAGSLKFVAMVMFGAADGTRLGPLTAIAATDGGAADSANAAPTSASAGASAGPAAAGAAVGTAAAAGGSGPTAPYTAAAEGWRRWLRSDGCGQRLLQVLGLILCNLHSVEWSPGRATNFLNALLAAAVAEPDALRTELRAAAAAVEAAEAADAPSGSGGGGHNAERRRGTGAGGSGGRRPAPAATQSTSPHTPEARQAISRLLCYTWGFLLGLPALQADPELSPHAAHVIAVLRCLCDGDEGPDAQAAAHWALEHPSVLGLRHWGAALLPPDEAGAGAGAGLPPACANPRCTNLAGDSDAELAAAAAAGGGGGQRRCGGGGRSWYCSAGCQGAHRSAGHGAECGGGVATGGGKRRGA
ncbi:hypothetical protein GPECTOR_36g47 [Gonium pectorale]|uniref:MYND-type domain-containing protein n=1 Tax=Gonium pectorale TaxID=33097 RepID=A0A150GC33_GONPE|nr:hypothetical protein GPECTOR_36g47 [Gonium pectorale]|eukprot:KXZ47323.1 hypothetical protein GPECTOR_36g47 [Gonium pectorale]